MTLQNWAGNITFSTDRLHRPGTVEELQQLVTSFPSVRALGTGHSFNRIADTTGDLISVAGLPSAIDIDEATRTVDVGAGIRYGELTVELQTNGWALHNLGSLPHISVAGACATGTHGSGDVNTCLAAAAVAIEFVSGDGELVRLAREDATFSGAVLSLGALGIATRLTLAIEPTYDIRQDVFLDAPLTTVVEHLGEILSSGYSVSVFTDFSRPDVVDKIWVKSRGDAPNGSAWGGALATEAQHPITGVDPGAATEQLGAVGPWHERLPHFRLAFTPSSGNEQQSEFLLPRENGPAALAAVRGLTLRPALEVCEVRTVAADDLWLSPCRGRDTVAFHFTWVDDDALVQPAVAALEGALLPLGARPHWGKVFIDHPGRHYPQLGAFRELAARYDPGRRFGNAFLESFVYQ